MLKAMTIVAAAALASTMLPSLTFAQMENGAMGGDSMSKGSMGGMGSKSSMMKKSRMRHHTMHSSMMKKKSMSNGSM